MRILVISDSHRSSTSVERAVSEQPTARHVFFLGDNTGDIEQAKKKYKDRIFHIVSGNCDYADFNPCFGIETVAGVGVFYTHGHLLGVKYGTERLYEKTKELGCKIALYGHTHIGNIEYRDGIYLVNPGSLSRSRQGSNSYAVIDIEPNGILPAIIKI